VPTHSPNGPPQLGTAGLGRRAGSVLPPQLAAAPCNVAAQRGEGVSEGLCSLRLGFWQRKMLKAAKPGLCWGVHSWGQGGAEMKGRALGGVEREAKNGGERHGNSPGAVVGGAWGVPGPPAWLLCDLTVEPASGCAMLCWILLLALLPGAALPRPLSQR